MHITHRDPWTRMRPRSSEPQPFEAAATTVPIDIWETSAEYVVKATMPGVRHDDMQIQVQGDTLRISGERKEPEIDRQKGHWLQREESFGPFQRTITLPAEVQADEAEAHFADGMLTVRLPKAKTARASSIPIRSVGGEQTTRSQTSTPTQPKGMRGESTMPAKVFVIPILPARTWEVESITRQLQGRRRKEHEESRRNLGITKERIWIQHLPDQDFAVVYFEAEDLDRVFQGLTESKDPLDLWYQDQLTGEGYDWREVTAQQLFSFPSEGGAQPPEEVSPAVAKWRGLVSPGMTVKGADGPSIGHITEVLDTDGSFLLERPGGSEWSLFVPYEAIQAISNREVTLTIPGNKVSEQGWWEFRLAETARG